MSLASWYTRLHDDRSGQCIYVILDELLVQKVGNQYQDSGSLQPQVITSRTWHKILVKYTIQMTDRSGTNVAQISVFSHIRLQYISHT